MNNEKIKQIRKASNMAYDNLDCPSTFGEMLTEYADLLESIDKAEPSLWTVNWTVELRTGTRAHTSDWTVTQTKQDAEEYEREGHFITPFYSHPPQQEHSPKVAPATVAIDERAEFEQKVKLGGISIKNDTARNIDGDYYSLPVQYAWEGWQAGRKLSAPVVPDEKTGLCVSDEADTFEIEQAAAYANGWNDCRAAMQAHCDAMLKGEK